MGIPRPALCLLHRFESVSMFISSNDLIDLSGRTAVVTGGGRGIGFATVERLARAGATVYMGDVDPAAAGAAAQLVEDGLDVRFVPLNVAVAAEQDAVASRVVADRGRLDVWVNNAGIFPSTPALEITDADWDRVMQVNVNGTFYGCRAAGRQMTSGPGGVIVNLASVSAFRVAGDGRVHYAASKGAVVSMTRAFARELGPSGVRVLAVAPTSIATEGVLAGSTLGTRFLDEYAKNLPLRRYGVADDIARVILFAVSDLAGILTGSVLAADAGQMAV
jgi:NAD(P)-dependent dehydrogenase (short-subunit alcohol dehydrogenase family)